MSSSQAVTTPVFMMVLERAISDSLVQASFALLWAGAVEQLEHPSSRLRPLVYAGEREKGFSQPYSGMA